MAMEEPDIKQMKSDAGRLALTQRRLELEQNLIDWQNSWEMALENPHTHPSVLANIRHGIDMTKFLIEMSDQADEDFDKGVERFND